MSACDCEGNPLTLEQLHLQDISGEAYTDGSCDQSWIPELKRAAWAFVITNSDGDPSVQVSGTVPRQLPQLRRPENTAPWLR